jgi:hypothetical protein
MILLSACGGGGGGPEADAGATATAPVAAPAAVAFQPAAGNASPVEIPSPPDMSIAPPPGTAVTSLPPDMWASVTSTDTTTDATTNSAAGSVATGMVAGSVKLAAVFAPADVPAELPEGAVACQPSTCPAFAVNGSVTNIQGAEDPTAAHAYLLPATGAVGGPYPDLGNLPTMVIPAVVVTVGEAPQ